MQNVSRKRRCCCPDMVNLPHPRAPLLQALIVEYHLRLMVTPIVLKEVFLARLIESESMAG